MCFVEDDLALANLDSIFAIYKQVALKILVVFKLNVLACCDALIKFNSQWAAAKNNPWASFSPNLYWFRYLETFNLVGDICLQFDNLIALGLLDLPCQPAAILQPNQVLFLDSLRLELTFGLLNHSLIELFRQPKELRFLLLRCQSEILIVIADHLQHVKQLTTAILSLLLLNGEHTVKVLFLGVIQRVEDAVALLSLDFIFEVGKQVDSWVYAVVLIDYFLEGFVYFSFLF